MRLTPGARLGPYELTGPLGVGGMGEVYRAHDARLNRDVAIKILPPLFAADPERIARFDREAQVLASLNHPNIAQIYGIEEAPAAFAPPEEGERSAEWPAKSDPQLRALVMELVEGEDLSERIARGPVRVDDALAIARQIAEALACAHEQGIVHRDLKPANVKIREDGTVKVLDFGLARLVDPSSGSSPSAALSPTITSPATQLGVILGTAAYMAPEQARGKTVDKRADVWAFGVVLFEMLTGRRAFEGSEVSDTLAFILTKDPDWPALPAETPAAIRRLLRRCLQKDPRQRLADMSDARLELDEAAAPLESERGIGAATPVSRRRWLVPALAAAIVAAALLGGVAAWWLLRPSAAPSSPLATFSIPLPDGIEFTNAGRHVVAISPDGRRIVYVANRQLYLRDVGSVAVKPIAGSETTGAVVGPAFSPDGQQIVYYSEGALRKIAVAGGTPMPLTTIASALGLQWSPGGIFVGLGPNGIGRIPADGGKPATIATVGPDESAQGPQLLPGGDVIIFTIATGALETRWDKARIVAHSLRTGERKVLVEGGSDARYVPTGHLLYAESGVVYAVPFDSATLAVKGARVAVIEGVRRTSVTGAAQFAVSSNGTVAYVPGDVRATEQRLIGYLDRSGNRVALPVPAGAYETPRVSPDGKLIAVGRYAGPRADIWIYDLSGSSAIRLLTFGGSNRFPAWSPDGRQVVFQSDREGDAGLFVQNISGAASRLTKAGANSSHVPNSWSRDGQWLLFTSVGSTTALHVLSLKDRTVKPLNAGGADGPPSGVFSGLRSAGGTLSADGQWVAYYAARPTGDLNVLVEPFPATGEKYQVTEAIHPAWSADGRELFASPNGPAFLVFRIATDPRFTFREVARIPRRGTVGTTPDAVRNYDVMPDGRLLVVMPSGDSTAALREVRVMLNWFEELKKR